MAPPVSNLRRLAWRGVAALPGPVRELAHLPVRLRADRELRSLAPMPAAGRRLYLGPLNTAGQAWQWARAAERHLADTAAQNLWVQRSLGQSEFGYPADHEISVRAQRGRVEDLHGERVLHEATHVVLESGRPVLEDFIEGSMEADVPRLEAAGIRTAVLWHGSEIRDLRAHAERYPHSPFHETWDDYFHLLQRTVDANRALLEGFDGPVLVSTPDLLEAVPGATWLPLVVDVDRFATRAPVLQRPRPVVLHAPSNPRLKGTAVVEEVLIRLAGEGLVDYRRLTGVPHAQMASFVAGADVVVDQIVLGNPGVLVAESWAAGCLVVAHLSPEVRRTMQEGDPDHCEVPAVEADPSTFEDVMREIAAHPKRFRETAEDGVGWARRNHDGQRSAQVLDEVLLSR